MIDNAKKIYLTVKDYTVSQETFGLYRDAKYDMLVTFPKPSEAELYKYYESEDYISHSNKKNGVISFIYQIVRSFTLKNKLNIIQHFKEEKGTLLDIGAGTGHFLDLAQKNNWTVTGIEPNAGAKKIAEEKGISFAENTQNLADSSYDVITMWHVLEHVYDLDKQIKELKRLLKPNGFIVVAVPNFRSFDAKHYKQFWAAYDVPRHLWHFSKKSIKVLFQEKKMKVVEIIPMKWDAFYVSLISEKYKRRYTNYFRAVYIGLKSNYKAKRRGQYSSLIYVIKNDQKRK